MAPPKLRLLSGSEPAPPPPDLLPERFEVREELGRGGMGVVYRAYDTHEQREVAVKVLPLTVHEGSALKRFKREAEELACLSHPNVVAFYGGGEHRQREYLVMELVEGGNLLDYLARQPTVAELVQVFRQICAGLEHIHAQGLVHRDLKPENLLLTPEGVPKITDLGLARRTEGRSKLTNDGTVVGTYTYVAPEQILSSKVGPPADLYALGAVMFEAFTGRMLFQADSEYALLQCHICEVPASPRALRPDMPPGLEKLILQLLKKRPQERPSSAHQVADLLDRCADPGQGLGGREDDVHRLEQALSRCQLGQSAACLLTAPSGLGRSRVVQEVCLGLSAYGLRLLRLGPDQSMPVQGLSEVYQSLGGEVESFLQLLACGGPAAAAEALRRALESNPHTLLIVDDMERLDSGSLATLRRLAGLSPPPATGWLLSCAASEAVSLVVAETTLVVELTGLLHDLIHSLAVKQLALLAKTSASARLEPHILDWVGRRAAGSPRRLKLLLLGLLRSGAIECDGDLWKRKTLLGESPPETLLIDLDEGLLRLLRAAALLEEPFAFEVLEGATGVSSQEAESGLDQLVTQGLLEETARGEHYAFASPAVRQCLVASLSERTLRRAQARIAQVLAGLGAPCGLRGIHLVEAQQFSEALPLLLQAAEQCQARGAFAEGYAFWQRASACLESNAAASLRLRIGVGSGECLSGSGRLAEATALLEKLLATPPSAMVEERGARLGAYRLLAQLKSRQTSDTEVLTLCRRGLSEAGQPLEPPATAGPGDAALQAAAAGIYLIMARSYRSRGESELADLLLPGALSLARVGGQAALQAQLLILEARLHSDAGRYPQAEQSLLHSLNLGRELLGPVHQLRCHLELGRLYLCTEDDQASRCLDQAQELARQLADRQAESQTQLALAQWHTAKRRQGATLDCLHRAVELVSDDPAASVQALTWLGLGYFDQDPARAETWLREALNQAPQGRGAMTLVFLGHLLRRQRRGEEAWECFEAALAASSEDPVLEARARVGLALEGRLRQSAQARTQATKACRALERGSSPGGHDLGLARWALGKVLLLQDDEDAGVEALRSAQRLLQGRPAWELRSLVDEAREDLRHSRVPEPRPAPPPPPPQEAPPQPLPRQDKPQEELIRLAIPVGRPQAYTPPGRRIPWRRTPLWLVLALALGGLLSLLGLGFLLGSLQSSPPGQVQIRLAHPPVTMWLDGKQFSLTQTGYLMDLAPGHHEVRAEAAGRVAATYPLEIKSGLRQVLEIKLAAAKPGKASPPTRK